MRSNILSVFSPPEQRTITDEEAQDCLPCQIMSTMFSLGFGSYLLSGKAFEYSAKEKARGISLEDFNKRNPNWWRTSIKGLGGILVIFGIVRGSEGWLWNTDKQYKKVLSSSNKVEKQP